MVKTLYYRQIFLHLIFVLCLPHENNLIVNTAHVIGKLSVVPDYVYVPTVFTFSRHDENSDGQKLAWCKRLFKREQWIPTKL